MKTCWINKFTGIQTENNWKFVHDPDEIAAFFQSQATVFLNFLQENYLNTMGNIEEVDISTNILSIADVLNSEWRVRLLFIVQLKKLYILFHTQWKHQYWYIYTLSKKSYNKNLIKKINIKIFRIQP